jgi:SAM-dependent methyltransferase
MSRFRIVLIRPEGYLHSEAFREIAETLQYGLQGIGHAAEIYENDCDLAATNLLLGAHLLTPAQAAAVPAGSILYNLEQLGGPNLSNTYYELASRHQIWDYSLRNIEKWQGIRCAVPPLHVPLGYVPELTRIPPLPPRDQDIDVLFYGSINERRKHILEGLRAAGVKVYAAFGLYGRDRDLLIARAKLVLNLHFYETQIFEIARISYLLANSKAVVSEWSEMESGLADAVLNCPYDRLVPGCLALLQNEDERHALQARGFQRFSQLNERRMLETALQKTAVASRPVTTYPPVPRKLNLGSGKDWREDYFNVDCNSFWEPDAVLDFNQPLPLGQPLETQRFGKVTLENNYFDEILAKDVMEHIPNLTTAMTSCLNLLRPGGLLYLSVPYDLSWGAWQDPTHVRAFNERSWLYYTEWCWYLGWMEARFEQLEFGLGLSPVGQALQKQQLKNEELVRYPRAVDQLRVVLRKRLMTEAEKQQVAAYWTRPNRHPAAPPPTPRTVPTVPNRISSRIPAEAGEPYITETIAGATSALTGPVQGAFEKAFAGRGEIDPGVLAIQGMSGKKYRLFINNLIKQLEHPRYLEVGTWAGSTLCSALNGNCVSATAIDNWSEFGGPKAQFLQNVERFKTSQAQLTFIESDFRKVNYSGLGRFNVYMFDGPHKAEDQYDGIALAQPALDEEFVLIVDDWNHLPAREGTFKALRDLQLSIRYSLELRTTLDGSHPSRAHEQSDWHNGYFIAVMAKPQAGAGA